MRVVGDDGVELDARFSIERWEGMTTLVFQSRSGKPKRNADYGDGLELLLARLGSLGCEIDDAWVDSQKTRNLPIEEKRLAITGVDYPIALAAMEASRLRLAMGRAQEKVNQNPGAVGGNSTKRIRLVLNVPRRLSPDQLETSLVGQTTSPKYFALLANPNRYRIEEAVHELPVDTWVTAGKNMQPGDRVIIWKAKGRGEERGIVALGQVVSGPEVGSDADNPYWLDPPFEPEERIKIRYEVPEGLPLWLGGDHDPVLEQLSVSRAQGGTVFHVTSEQWKAVVDAAGGATTPTWRQPQDDAKPARRRSQGRNLSPGKRKAIEEWAVKRAIERFPDLDLRDVGLTKTWDLEDTSVDPHVHIEVKGSTQQLEKIILTDKQVEHAKEARDEGVSRLILVVVEGIELGAGDGEDEWIASGGEVRVYDPWEIDEAGLEPVQWRYRFR